MTKIAYWELKITDDEYIDLKRDENKEYVAGYLMGRLQPKFLAQLEIKHIDQS